MSKQSILSDVLEQTPNRRALLKKFGIATAAAGAAAATAGLKLNAQSSLPSAVDVLQFALNLEYLEAEFYTTATMGVTIDQLGIGISSPGQTAGPTTGWQQVNFPNSLVYTLTVANQIGNDERNHVTLIRTALQNAGVTPVAKPAINLAALGMVTNELQFLTLARVFEDIGVSAYGGGADPTATQLAASPYIGVAARILATEAEHVANIRLQVARLAVPSTQLDGVDIIPPPSGSAFFSVDPTTGLTAVRTPGQVLYLAYGGAGLTAGGFFPNGVNGTINTSSAHA
ncbi:MAG: ferritin-like domain-containing protein [Acidobacteriaceae bacterium]|nr:ferritin-like domain-containing protein [Acidobacteriaceae bacterium]